MVHKSIQEFVVDNNTTSNTPNKPTVLNQTPLRSTSSFLTPPSSDERPAAQAFSLVTTQPAPLFQTENSIPLTQKILAQSALYSQAIQKQQQQHSTSTEQHSASNNTPAPAQGGAVLNPFPPQHRLAPQLTYHQLQQQQFLNRQNINTQQNQKKQVGPTEGERLLSPSSNLTAIELPSGAAPRDVDAKSNMGKKANEGTAVTESITKADPLDNPLKCAVFMWMLE